MTDPKALIAEIRGIMVDAKYCVQGKYMKQKCSYAVNMLTEFEVWVNEQMGLRRVGKSLIKEETISLIKEVGDD